MKVLVIEDSQRLLRSLGHGLKKAGLAVDLVADGPEGLDYARRGDYDAIVLDFMLLGMDGLSNMRELRTMRTKTHILILSAKDLVADRIRGLQIGADDYMVKPFSFDELRALEHLDAQELRCETPGRLARRPYRQHHDQGDPSRRTNDFNRA